MYLAWTAAMYVLIVLVGGSAVLAVYALAEMWLADARKPSTLSRERQLLREQGERDGLWQKIERECL